MPDLIIQAIIQVADTPVGRQAVARTLRHMRDEVEGCLGKLSILEPGGSGDQRAPIPGWEAPLPDGPENDGASWDDDAKSRLDALVSGNHATVQEMAVALGRSRGAVANMMHKRGLTLHQNALHRTRMIVAEGAWERGPTSTESRPPSPAKAPRPSPEEVRALRTSGTEVRRLPSATQMKAMGFPSDFASNQEALAWCDLNDIPTGPATRAMTVIDGTPVRLRDVRRHVSGICATWAEVEYKKRGYRV